MGRRVVRWMLLALVLCGVAALAWFLHFRVVATGLVKGQIVTFSAPGPVVVREVYVTSGQWCKQGSALIRLAARDVEARRAMLEARLTQAQLRVELASRGAEWSGVPLSGRLDNRDRLAAELRGAEAAVERSLAQWQFASQEFERYADLRARGQAAEREFQAARTAEIAAAAELTAARARVEGLRAASDRYRELVPEIAGGTDLRRLELAYLQAGVEEAAERLRDFDTVSGTRTMTAPFAGRVDRVYALPGQHLKRDDALLCMYAPSSLYVTVYADPGDQERLEVGAPVSMYPEGSWSAIPGRITEIHTGWSQMPASLRDSPEQVVPAVTLRVDTNETARHRLAPNMVLKVVAEAR